MLKQKSVANTIYDIILNMVPIDELEDHHIKDTLPWLKSGVPIFRIAKPNIPDKHLVSYFVLFDQNASKILLVDHKKAGLWLPSGGHVEIDENPKDTVVRECFEELGINANFLYTDPIFLTSTITVGLTAGHTDVSLWYVLRGDHRHEYKFDTDEFYTIKWFGLDEIPYERADPHMHRFINKLLGCEIKIKDMQRQEASRLIKSEILDE
jgi:8-oxo-dGTP diphosphatase